MVDSVDQLIKKLEAATEGAAATIVEQLSAKYGAEVAAAQASIQRLEACLDDMHKKLVTGDVNFGGRRKRDPETGERVHLGIRVTPEMKQRLERTASLNGRSQSQEAEIRIERSFDREDLLPEVLTLAYGREVAGILMMLGVVMTEAGYLSHAMDAVHPAELWTDDSDAFHLAIQAATALLNAARPLGRAASNSRLGLQCAFEMINALRGKPMQRKRYTRYARSAHTIRPLLGPIAARMTKAMATRSPDVDAAARIGQAATAAAADAVLNLINSGPHTPSRQALAEAIEKQFQNKPVT
jgi:hypothetical protein